MSVSSKLLLGTLIDVFLIVEELQDWRATRPHLRSAPSRSARSSVSGDDESATDIRGSQQEMRRTCHSLSRGGDARERLHTSKCHPVQFTTPPSGPEHEQCLMKNGSHYEPDPTWSELLTPTSYSCDPPPTPPPLPPHITVSWPLNLPRTLKRVLMCRQAKVPFWRPRGTFWFIMDIALATDRSVHFLN